MVCSGARVFSAAVEMASNPMYEKKASDAPVQIPCQPPGAKGCQCAGLTKAAPTPTNRATSPSLKTTSAAFSRALSRMPQTSTTVRAAVISAAGRLNAMVIPPRWGAAAAIAGSCAAVCRSVAIQAGKSTPNAPSRNDRK